MEEVRELGGNPRMPPLTSVRTEPCVSIRPAKSDLPMPGLNSDLSMPVLSAQKTELPRVKRKQVERACANCRRSKTACSSSRPCHRCIKLDIADSCVDAPRKRRTVRKAGSPAYQEKAAALGKSARAKTEAGRYHISKVLNSNLLHSLLDDIQSKQIPAQTMMPSMRRDSFPYSERAVHLSHGADPPQIVNYSPYTLASPLPSISSLPISNAREELHLFPESGVAMTTPYLQRLFSTAKSNTPSSGSSSFAATSNYPLPTSSTQGFTTNSSNFNTTNNNHSTSNNTSTQSSQGRYQNQGQNYTLAPFSPFNLMESNSPRDVGQDCSSSVLEFLLLNNKDQEERPMNMLHSAPRRTSSSSISSDLHEDGSCSSDTAEELTGSPLEVVGKLHETFFDSDLYRSTLPLVCPNDIPY